MHRHGTLKGRWKALAFGTFWFVVGLLIARLGWVGVFAESVPRPPDLGEALALIVGSLIMLAGAILGLTPHVIWVLRTLYREDFAKGAQCPIMVVCGACGTYNPRIRSACKQCDASLAGARAAGGSTPVVPLRAA